MERMEKKESHWLQDVLSGVHGIMAPRSDTSVITLRAEEAACWGKCLLCKHGDLGSDPQK